LLQSFDKAKLIGTNLFLSSKTTLIVSSGLVSFLKSQLTSCFHVTCTSMPASFEIL